MAKRSDSDLGDLITTAELCRRLKLSPRSVARAVSRGCPVHKGKSPSGRGGKAPNLFYLREVEDWFAVNVRGGSIRAGASLSPPVAALPRSQNAKTKTKRAGNGSRKGSGSARSSSAKSPRNGISASQSIDDLAKAVDVETLVDMKTRLEDAEAATFETWSLALESNQKKPGTYSASELKLLQASWQDVVERRRKLEKELPVILYRRGRYVDATVVGRVLAKAVQSMVADLQTVGIKVAPRCVGKSGREIRIVVDEAVRDARRHLRDMLRGFVPDVSAGEP